jgi:hypothetical protein
MATVGAWPSRSTPASQVAPCWAGRQAGGQAGGRAGRRAGGQAGRRAAPPTHHVGRALGRADCVAQHLVGPVQLVLDRVEQGRVVICPHHIAGGGGDGAGQLLASRQVLQRPGECWAASQLCGKSPGVTRPVACTWHAQHQRRLQPGTGARHALPSPSWRPSSGAPAGPQQQQPLPSLPHPPTHAP